MKQYIKEKREELSKFLDSYFDNKSKELSSINRWGEDGIKRLKEFTLRGKMIRGSLVLLSYQLNHEKYNDNTMKAAAAAEIFHSGILIHDDIMDQDKLRRGKPTVYAQYERTAEENKLPNPLHYGYSQAITVGDIAFFITFEILSGLNIDSKTKDRLINLISKELVCVGLGQMEDVYLSKIKNGIEEKDILNVFKYKTARYTFSLPMMAGAVLAGNSQDQLDILEKLGENIGLVFQVKDDELGMFGNPKKSGKPVGSDIRECKKTLYYYYLYKLLEGKDLSKINAIYCGEVITAKELNEIRKLIMKYDIDKKVTDILGKYTDKSRKLISSLETKEDYKKTLNQLLDYIVTREK